jgi:hypothetical protein
MVETGGLEPPTPPPCKRAASCHVGRPPQVRATYGLDPTARFGPGRRRFADTLIVTAVPAAMTRAGRRSRRCGAPGCHPRRQLARVLGSHHPARTSRAGFSLG